MKHFKSFESVFDDIYDESEFEYAPYYDIDLTDLKEYLDEKKVEYFEAKDVNGIFEIKYGAALQINPAYEVYAIKLEHAKGTGKNEYYHDAYSSNPDVQARESRFLQDCLLFIIADRPWDATGYFNRFTEAHPEFNVNAKKQIQQQLG